MAAQSFLALVMGVPKSILASALGGAANANAIVALNAQGTLDPSVYGAGIGADTLTLQASEAISAGALVNIWNNGGTAMMRNADSATANAGKKAHGFCAAAVAANANGTMYRSGQNTGVTGLTPGTEYYLGASGAVQTLPATPPSGSTLQFIGVAQTATLLDVQPGTAYAIS